MELCWGESKIYSSQSTSTKYTSKLTEHSLSHISQIDQQISKNSIEHFYSNHSIYSNTDYVLDQIKHHQRLYMNDSSLCNNSYMWTEDRQEQPFVKPSNTLISITLLGGFKYNPFN